MDEYREIRPPLHLANTIECFWTMRRNSPAELHRVVPDGCADILFTRTSGAVTLEAIGPMTAYRDVPVLDGRLLVGMRFHPGHWTAALGTPGDRVTDRALPLDDLWGSRARELLDRLSDAPTPEQCARIFSACVAPTPTPGRIQRALAWIADRRGIVSIDDLANQAGISPRQLRRVCLEQTGLTPKFLARVLRFRHALSRVHDFSGHFAEFALDCGYYDQAHFIKDFRQLSGWTPSSRSDGRFFQSPSGL